ncbi:MAG: hypothetical protein Q9227_003576 [Pyrenula ochraceoflavens]
MEQNGLKQKLQKSIMEQRGLKAVAGDSNKLEERNLENANWLSLKERDATNTSAAADTATSPPADTATSYKSDKTSEVPVRIPKGPKYYWNLRGEQKRKRPSKPSEATEEEIKLIAKAYKSGNWSDLNEGLLERIYNKNELLENKRLEEIQNFFRFVVPCRSTLDTANFGEVAVNNQIIPLDVVDIAVGTTQLFQRFRDYLEETFEEEADFIGPGSAVAYKDFIRSLSYGSYSENLQSLLDQWEGNGFTAELSEFPEKLAQHPNEIPEDSEDECGDDWELERSNESNSDYLSLHQTEPIVRDLSPTQWEKAVRRSLDDHSTGASGTKFKFEVWKKLWHAHLLNGYCRRQLNYPTIVYGSRSHQPISIFDDKATQTESLGLPEPIMERTSSTTSNLTDHSSEPTFANSTDHWNKTGTISDTGYFDVFPLASSSRKRTAESTLSEIANTESSRPDSPAEPSYHSTLQEDKMNPLPPTTGFAPPEPDLPDKAQPYAMGSDVDDDDVAFRVKTRSAKRSYKQSSKKSSAHPQTPPVPVSSPHPSALLQNPSADQSSSTGPNAGYSGWNFGNVAPSSEVPAAPASLSQPSPQKSIPSTFNPPQPQIKPIAAQSNPQKTAEIKPELCPPASQTSSVKSDRGRKSRRLDDSKVEERCQAELSALVEFLKASKAEFERLENEAVGIGKLQNAMEEVDRLRIMATELHPELAAAHTRHSRAVQEFRDVALKGTKGAIKYFYNNARIWAQIGYPHLASEMNQEIRKFFSDPVIPETDILAAGTQNAQLSTPTLAQADHGQQSLVMAHGALEALKQAPNPNI